MSLKISKTTHNQVYEILSKYMKKEQVAISKTKPKNIYYIGAFKNGNLIGCVALQKIGNKIRYKTDFIMPNYRTNGIYKKLFNAREKVKQFKYNDLAVTAYCSKNSINTFLSNGFKIKKELKNGIKFVEREAQNGTS